MVDTDWGLVADARINSQLDFSKIKTKEDFIKAVRGYLDNTPDSKGRYLGRNILHAQRRDSESILEEMWGESRARSKVEDERKREARDETRALRRAQAFEGRRPRSARVQDERVTARDTRRPTGRNVRRWIRQRGRRSDIRGVDSKIVRRRATENLITRGDLSLRNIQPVVDRRGVKRYRSVETGKWTSNPYRRRK